ncbi:serine hydrolase domain-containing protein [Tsukamurella soli]|uniref:serine hydrolase domain-containing protein n=1 Tax=Tsukamurella soli TaxID=644556 RepID=UPI003619F718
MIEETGGRLPEECPSHSLAGTNPHPSPVTQQLIGGDCDSRFQRVREEFERNFAERGELGASVCVMVDGETVVDLWGGIADPKTGQPWNRDTVNVVMSCSKGLTATCLTMLVDRGRIDLDQPVARYWPEFGRNGKSEITVRQVATHQSGVAHVTGRVPPGGMCDWNAMVALLERQAPLWQPGTRTGYHSFTIGFILGELLSRVDGRSIGTFLRDEIAEPLGLDCWIGLPADIEPRVAPSIPAGVASPPAPGSILELIATNSGGWFSSWDSREAHAAELPASGAVSNARGLAGHYAPSHSVDHIGVFGCSARRPPSDCGIHRRRATSMRCWESAPRIPSDTPSLG